MARNHINWRSEEVCVRKREDAQSFFTRYAEQLSDHLERRVLWVLWRGCGPCLQIAPWWRGCENMSYSTVLVYLWPGRKPGHDELSSPAAIDALMAYIKAEQEGPDDDPGPTESALEAYRDIVDPVDVDGI